MEGSQHSIAVSVCELLVGEGWKGEKVCISLGLPQTRVATSDELGIFMNHLSFPQAVYFFCTMLTLGGHHCSFFSSSLTSQKVVEKTETKYDNNT